MLVIICMLSEKLAKQAKCLKHKIMEKPSNLTNTALAVQDDSNDICSLLDEFKGFDANGFFILNHSLLTSYAVNFLTFIVILIGFNQDHFY